MTPNHTSLWKKCLSIIEPQLQPEVFRTLFSQAVSESYDGHELTLRIPSEYFIEQFEKTYSQVYFSALRQVYGPDASVKYSYDVVSFDPTSRVTIASSAPSAAVMQAPGPKKQIHPGAVSSGVDYEAVDPQLNPTYNFANYCVGESNRLAFNIGYSIGSDPGKTVFNPFFLYGGTGVGKTHLMQAIGIRIKELYPMAKVLYISARQFENHYGTSVANKNVNGFINFYQGFDVLLIDDIQDLSGKKGTQNAFFPIFNFLHQKGRILVLTSDRPPVELEDIMASLISRFKWGVVQLLPNPDLELRRSILRKKCAQNGLDLAPEVIDVIAENVTDSVRELEGIVISLISRATLMNQTITPELAKVVMQSAVKLNKREVNFDMVVETTAAFFNIDVDVIFSRSRLRDINDARQAIMYLAHKLTGLSCKSIGYKLNRERVTVLHGIKAVANRISVDPAAEQDIAKIEHMLRTGE